MSRPSFLVRLLRRHHRESGFVAPTAPAPAVAAGSRGTSWLLVGNQRARAGHLACALAQRGAAVALVWRGQAAMVPPPLEGLRVLDSWSLSDVRKVFSGEVERLRVLIDVADAETIALARDLGASGARIAYDALPAQGASSQVLSYDAETERALVGAVEDLIAIDSRGARHLSALSTGGRLVHVLPDPDGADGWTETAAKLESVAERPSIAVLLATGEDRGQTLAAVEAFLAARRDGAYRLAVVAGAGDPAGDELEAREEEGDFRLLRCPRPGRAAAWNLGLAATSSEFVVLADATQQPSGEGWLAPAVDAFSTRRELGALGFRAPEALLHSVGRGGKSLAAGGLLALQAPGLMVPRKVLRRCGEFDEELDTGGLAWLDLSFRIRDLGLRLAPWVGPGLQAVASESGPPPVGLRRKFQRRWAARPKYLEESADF